MAFNDDRAAVEGSLEATVRRLGDEPLPLDLEAVDEQLEATLRRLGDELETLDVERLEAFHTTLEAMMGAPSEVLKEVIRQRGLTPYRISKMSGASIDAIRRFLVGERGLSVATFDQVCTALGLELVEAKPRRARRSTRPTTRATGGHDDHERREGDS